MVTNKKQNKYTNILSTYEKIILSKKIYKLAKLLKCILIILKTRISYNQEDMIINISFFKNYCIIS